nr:AAA family ATPase [uncultured Carboxylicivirga sp.]
MKNKIQALIDNPSNEFQKIIDSEEFYFQKGQDNLNAFLEFAIIEEDLDKLIDDSNNYRDFETKAIENSLYNEVLEYVNNIVAYCDVNAKDKRVLNKYEDKRVLAKAAVRQSNWIKNIIAYKKNPELVNATSIRNAIDYLLNPNEGITVLSESHREMISDKILGIDYIKETFLNELKEYFSEFDLKLRNQANFTRLISNILYDIKGEWMESIVGLMASDSTGWQSDFIKESSAFNASIVWNSKRPSGTVSTIKALKQILTETGSFNLYYTSKGVITYKAEVIDFVENQDELSERNWKDIYTNIYDYSDLFSDYNDGKKNATIVFLLDNMVEIDPISISEFNFYGSYQPPTQDNLAPISSEPEFNLLQNQDMNTIDNYIELLKHKKQIILQGPPGTGKTYTAKDIAEQMIFGKVSDDKRAQKKRLEEDTDQFQLVQFHPSYSYEDFVRGITAKNNEDGQIEYVTEDKLLMRLVNICKELKHKKSDDLNRHTRSVNALLNNDEDKYNASDFPINYWFQNFKKEIETVLNKGKSYMVNNEVIVEGIYNDKSFTLRKNTTKSGISFGDLKNYLLNQYFNMNKPISSREPYINTFLQPFTDNFYSFIIRSKPQLQPTVLIIDEINRANLSSVLGELIYGLEYRGEKVESMYAIVGDASIVIPENLYIIGTMNTADRSVGHIDYAIRRRFAFESILPNISVIKNPKAKELFSLVAALFVDEENGQKKNSMYLAPDFDYKDVQLGHSYFIVKDSEELRMRLKYEILPILNEYMKDGLLMESATEQIEKIASFEC